MKNLIKTITLISILSLTSFLGQAQNKPISIGFRAGLNHATIFSDNIPDNKWIMGASIAIPVEFSLGNTFSLQPELSFIQKGVSNDLESSEFSSDSKINNFTNYLELPVLLKAKFGSEMVKAYVIAGPSIGYAANKYDVNKINDDRDVQKVDFFEGANQSDNRFDFGASVGLGTELSFGPGAFVVDVRYNLDFNDNTKFENDAPNNWNKAKNGAVNLSAGYMLRF